MKRLKSLKQQMTTAISLTLVVLVIAVCAPEQVNAQQRMRRGASAKVQRQSQAGKPTQLAGFWDTGSGFRFLEAQRQSQMAKPGRLGGDLLEGGAGHDNVQRQSNANPRVNRPRRRTGEGVYWYDLSAKARGKQGR